MNASQPLQNLISEQVMKVMMAPGSPFLIETMKIANLFRKNYETKQGLTIPSVDGLTEANTHYVYTTSDAQETTPVIPGKDVPQHVHRGPTQLPSTGQSQTRPTENVSEENGRRAWVKRLVWGSIGTALVIGALSLGAIISHWVWPRVVVAPAGDVQSWIESNGFNVPAEEIENGGV